jgi:hypothetical protein
VTSIVERDRTILTSISPHTVSALRRHCRPLEVASWCCSASRN